MRVEGPERIAMEWWRDAAGHALMRDYFRVESREGVRVWLYREWPRDPSCRPAGSCTACSHEQCRHVSRRQKSETPEAEQPAAPAYAELAVTTNFSFLRGASHPEGIHPAAAALGLAGIGIADRNSVAGVVRAYHELEAVERASAAKDTPASIRRS